MCGIVGYVGPREATSVLLDGLRRLEYRGYDSSGIAVAHRGGDVDLRRRVGKVDALAESLAREPIAGEVGIAHTRWFAPGITDASAARAAMIPVTNATPCCTRYSGVGVTPADDMTANIIMVITTR